MLILASWFYALVNFVQCLRGSWREGVHLCDRFEGRWWLSRDSLDQCLGAHWHESARPWLYIFATWPFLLLNLDLLDKFPLMLVHHYFDWSDHVSLFYYFRVVIFLQLLWWNFLVMMVVVRALRLLLGQRLLLNADESVYARVLNKNVWLLL